MQLSSTLLRFCRKALLMLALMALFISCKRDKLVESSVKGRPVWVYGIEPNYVIAEGKGRTHDEARNDAFMNVKESIVNSISVNVSSTVQMEISERVIDNLWQYKENTKVNTTVSSNFLRSLRGLHINKATDWYWELRRTPEKERYVVYHVKYPFSETELQNYIREWEMLDAEMGRELVALGERAERSNTINELTLLKHEAEKLAGIFKEPRRTLALNTAARIGQKLDDTRLEVVSHQRGELMVMLRSNGTQLRSTDGLRFDSKCARLDKQQYLEVDGAYLIHYDVAFCTGAEDSFTLSTAINGRNLTLNVGIPADLAHVRLAVNGPLQLHRTQGNLHEWRLPVRLYGNDTLEVTEIEISLERTSGRFLASLSRKGRAGLYTLIQQPLQATLSGKGDHTLRFEAPKLTNEADEIFSSLFENSSMYSASGKVIYRRSEQSEERSYRFDQLHVVLR